ncbi:hypothetical protein GGF43_004994 [Coemansia sp. RSA 2618]|nr:hypothetical protein GGF43_004994 [Coemansia sp. RSA 2618]
MGYGGFEAGMGAGMGYGGFGAGMGAGMGAPWAPYGNAGGFIPMGPGHGVIQGASTSGTVIQGPSGVIVVPPQSAGSIVF